MLYNVVLVSALQEFESAIYIYISPPSEPPSHLPLPHFTPLDHHRALGKAPCAKYESFASYDPLPPKSWDNWSLPRQLKLELRIRKLKKLKFIKMTKDKRAAQGKNRPKSA